MIKKGTFLTFIIVSVLSVLFLISGFTLAIIDIVQPSTQSNGQDIQSQQKQKQNNGLLVGLGDSLTRGIGSSQGGGFLQYAYVQIKEEEKEAVQLVNLAIGGQTTSELSQQLHNKEVQQTIGQARWIVLSIGGNDLFGETHHLHTIQPHALRKAQHQYSQRLHTILRKIRQHNQTASIFLIGLYNPFADQADAKETSHIVSVWNQETMKVVQSYEQIVVVPTFDLFQLNPKPYLYSDHFHPNDAGYKEIGIRLYQAMKGAHGDAP